MKPTNELKRVGEYIGHALHLDTLKRALAVARNRDAQPVPEWVIVYRTAQGFCCLYHGVPMDFREMSDVHVWAEEEGIQTYFMGL